MQDENSQSAPAAEKSLEELLAEAQAKIDQQRDTMMRALAEAENARKRAQAEAAGAQKYALERFAEELLPVMDSLEAALKAKDVSGVELTQRQLKAALDKASIREVAPAAGERFDPNRHQAMAAVPSPEGEKREPNTVVAVLQKGYTLHDRVLRAALVTVAKPASDPISGQDPN
jgi:molecular chaperone GrpE